MKLRYLKAKNVLSFGDEGIELEFYPYNVIVGPNDSGKTNLFRVLNLIEKTFDYRTPSLDGILFQGDMERSLHLEVGVELDDTEIEFLSTMIICSEMKRVYQPEATTSEIAENNYWKSILKKYGRAILLKSLRRLSFVLEKDELNTSEPKLYLKISNKSRSIFMNRRSDLSETPRDISSYLPESLVRLIISDFNSKYQNKNDIEIDALLQNEDKLSKECPSLVELFIAKLEGDPFKVVNLRGLQNINQLQIDLRGDPFVAKLSRLGQQRKIDLQNVNPWNILQRMYRMSFVRLQELRISPPSLDSSSKSQNYGESTILGNDLARKLFWLTNSGTPIDRERYNKIQEEFVKLTDSEFDVAIRTKNFKVLSEGKLGAVMPREREPIYLNQTEFLALGVGKESKTRVMNEAYIQVIKNNYPIAIEQTASGLYEILFLLTTIIGESEKILLLDEPELHLHPTMQKRILNLLSESKDQSRNQIILITHSPFLVSETDIDTTWRFSKRKADIGTETHNLGGVLSDLDIPVRKKLKVKLFRSDIHSLLFSRGVIFVEGPSDKIVLEHIDRYLSMKKKGAEFDENEWSVIDIGGKKSLSQFLILSRTLGIPRVAVTDYDALMHRDSRIELNGNNLKTSSIIYSLWHSSNLSERLSRKIKAIEIPESKWYDQSHLEDLNTLCMEHDIFVFSTDLEGVIQSQKTSKRGKPLKALEKVLKLISQDSIPSEFYEVCKFLSECFNR